ncbi:PQQ-dependent sugar dehydrogenase [Flavobacterium sp. ENC]|uniref:PQQ-dependent sugar dehydrogenase n=1 Tax=Flavobacterium sp. ENC TaxID=2897330 RepID=UPI001E56CD12|nr:PQQ-dependent sugar dehydrogenase [Flavobacterium sp. ENC]MCD0465626.1 PQQ-dependent sugar dehydrogenase [Flavobacterium sp. ENC]
MKNPFLKKQNVFVYLSVLFLALTQLSCNNDDNNNNGDDDDDDVPVGTLPPVETKPANSTYVAAFKGQTRIAGIKTETAYTSKVFAEGLASPWGMDNLPDGRIIVTQKAGTMRIVTQAGTVGGTITGIPAVNSNGQGGLLDVAVDPDFATNRMIYWSFSFNGTAGTATAVAKGKLSADETKIENAVVIYKAIPEFNSTLHYGSRLAWDKQGNLFVSTGERSDIASRPLAQKLDAALGKIVRITKNGEPAAGNPFIGQTGVLPEIYSYGHRNPQGLAVHPVTGELWEAEHGPLGGDEINRIAIGKNYGWPTITYGLEYSGAKIGDGITTKSGMEQPVYYWDPVVSPSGITFYSGNLIPEWKNNLFAAALSGQHVVRLVLKDNVVVAEERLLTAANSRFRDVLEGKDGALYAVTDGANAKIYKIAK